MLQIKLTLALKCCVSHFHGNSQLNLLLLWIFQFIFVIHFRLTPLSWPRLWVFTWGRHSTVGRSEGLRFKNRGTICAVSHSEFVMEATTWLINYYWYYCYGKWHWNIALLKKIGKNKFPIVTHHLFVKDRWIFPCNAERRPENKSNNVKRDQTTVFHTIRKNNLYIGAKQFLRNVLFSNHFVIIDYTLYKFKASVRKQIK